MKDNKVIDKLNLLRPVFAKASVGDFTASLEIPPDEDEFTEIFVGIKVMLQVINDQINSLTQSDKMKDEFLALAAHQLRSPLSIMKWDMELLNKYRDKLPQEIVSKIDILSKNNKRMINLVNDLLAVSRINQGKVRHNIGPVDVTEAIKKNIDDFQPLIQAKEVKVDLVPNGKLPPVYVDQEKLFDVFMNILGNAIKFTPALGQIDVVLNIDQAGEFVIVEISDSGIGIPQSEMDKVSEKFFRATNAVEGQSSGTGLGLFIVKSYLDTWEGKLKIESPANKRFQDKLRRHDLPGTSVYIYLPTKGVTGN